MQPSNTTLSTESAKTAHELIALGQSLNPTPSYIGAIPTLTLLGERGEVEVKTFEHLLLNPVRPRATVYVNDAASFIAYIKRYQTLSNRSQQVVFADISETGAVFKGILDYHDATSSPVAQDTEQIVGGQASAPSTTAGCTGVPQWGEHRVIYTCTQTPEWKRWLGHNGPDHRMTHVEFAEFIEDNAEDINPRDIKGTPSMADMIEISRSLDATSNGSFNSAFRLSNGEVQFKWTETVEAKAQTTSGEIKVPEKFLIGIPPFVGFDGFEIWARLKYRISNGKLSIWYELERPYKVIERASKQVIDKIATEAGLTPFLGHVDSMGLSH